MSQRNGCLFIVLCLWSVVLLKISFFPQLQHYFPDNFRYSISNCGEVVYPQSTIETIVITPAGGDILEKTQNFLRLQNQALKAFLPRHIHIIVDDMPQSNITFSSLRTICEETKSICVPSYRVLGKSKLSDNNLDAFSSSEALHSGLRFFDSVTPIIKARYLLILDLDMILLRPLNITEELSRVGNPAIIGINCPVKWESPEFNTSYSLWNGFGIYQLNRIPPHMFAEINFDPIRGVGDSGASSLHYLHKNPEVSNSIFWTSQKDWKWCLSQPPSLCLRQFFVDHRRITVEEDNRGPTCMLDGSIFHYLSGTNWNRRSASWHFRRLAHLQEFFLNVTHVPPLCNP
jgi:hypothetical protein